ncbi:MAG: hypothetical protein FWD14_04990 [Treponema sp.]|nr:hypothetical protein [Treponema sp.]
MVNFVQSSNDFPLVVSLGEKEPSCGLSRWGGKERLMFIPPCDEGLLLRGNNRQLVYKGRKQSHRYTILGDGAFEYDCILNKEPESNVVVLRMEGAEHYDFFRQPDFVRDDFLKGSYAVYKKQTLVGQGTGKLCHIHRPLIIDARGRKVWGELSVVGNELRITIPEQWLSEAKYPVVVDPTVGSTQLGSQTHWDNEDNESYDPLHIEVAIAVNRFLIPETLNGLATGYIYAYNNDYDPPVRPALYSDNNNSPLTRRSANEGFYDIEVRAGKPASWRSATFQTNTSISSGSYVWYGFCSWWYATRFDYGARCYLGDWSNNSVIPNTFPIYNVNWYENFKLTMYFTYSSAQNYVRTLTQGVRLTDVRSNKADYNRLSTQTTRASDLLQGSVSFFRSCLSNAFNNTSMIRTPTFIRTRSENIGISGELKNNREIKRQALEDVQVNEKFTRSQGFIRSLIDDLFSSDNFNFDVLILRSISENVEVKDIFIKLNEYFCNLYEEAGIIEQIERQGDFYRTEKENVIAEGSLFRQLCIFIKLFSSSIVRDFILKRFLIAREELVLKSNITRDLILESKIS